MTLSVRLTRCSALGTVLGGLLWAGSAAIVASRPPGIPGGEYRHTDDLGPFVFAALLLIAGGMTGLYTRYTGRPALAGLVVAVTGVAMIITGSALQVLGASSLTPLLIIPGSLSLVAGSVLAAVALLRSGIWPRRTGGLLIGASLLLLLFNSEDDRAWFAVPFGLAWAIVGCVQATRRAAVRHAV